MKKGGRLKDKIREVENFPTKDIKFKDITPLLEDKDAFKKAVDLLVKAFKGKKINKVVGIESRGFPIAGAIAYNLGAGMVLLRKPGKLPFKKIVQKHTLEYGESQLEMHTDSVKAGEKVLIIDDLLATGGTVEAAIKLVKKLGGKIVGLGFLIEILLGGQKKLKKYGVPICSIITYDKNGDPLSSLVYD